MNREDLMSQPRSRTLLTTSRFHVEELSYQARDGVTHQRAVVRHPGAVTILPLVTQRQVCLIRNLRMTVAQTLIELPAGTLEEGERPEETAARELQEETGFRAGRLTPLHAFFLSPGILDERMHLFLAEQLVMEGARREPGEQIENLIVDWDEALRMVRSGEIQDAKTIVGLLYYEHLHRGA
jgi:ADP-ribose pyrophosphatase